MKLSKQVLTTYFFLGVAIISIIAHYIISKSLSMEEPVFFFLFLFLMVGFVISIIFNIWNFSKKGTPEDLWMLGWLGVIGLLGIVPGFNLGFLGFFGFFGFFGQKKHHLL